MAPVNHLHQMVCMVNLHRAFIRRPADHPKLLARAILDYARYFLLAIRINDLSKLGSNDYQRASPMPLFAFTIFEPAFLSVKRLCPLASIPGQHQR